MRDPLLPNDYSAGKGVYGKPDLDNKCYIRIDAQILEALYKHGFTKNQLELNLFIIRKTWGFRKKEDWITASQIEKEIGINQPDVSKNINSLIKMNVIHVREEKKRRKIKRFYKFNKYWKTWKKYDNYFNEQNYRESLYPDNKNIENTYQNYRESLYENIENTYTQYITSTEDKIDNIYNENQEEEMKDSTKWIMGYNSWLLEKGLEPFELSEFPEGKRIGIYKITDSYLKVLDRLRIKKFPKSIGSSKYIKWMKYFFFGEHGLPNTTWEKYTTIFNKSYVSLFEIYWSRKKSKIYADQVFGQAIKFYYEDDIPKQYSITGYQKVSQEIEQMLAYPLSWPYIKHIINYIKKNKLAVWELSKIDRWKREGLFDVSSEEILGRELNEDEKIVHELTLLLRSKKVKKSTIVPDRVPDWVTVGKKSYDVEEMIKKYGYDKYWTRRTKISKV